MLKKSSKISELSPFQFALPLLAVEESALWEGGTKGFGLVNFSSPGYVLSASAMGMEHKLLSPLIARALSSCQEYGLYKAFQSSEAVHSDGGRLPNSSIFRLASFIH